ncbi:endo-1,4-beta-xylanase [Jeotgalibacillus sp. ET6]|uniref:endo-1,4-beta-xylanase n=1 Tax=Jeotgalibacillus sp. ET6 TaxID=3037260 RepID=UPI0024188E26|nr:endo-1,4-beta-xylanase [Jeotgalibacillus sp. ET6]MDG5472351.1 endo-1,4-beta-xylanase [Jeotgalibacillus sp. ET6]
MQKKWMLAMGLILFLLAGGWLMNDDKKSLAEHADRTGHYIGSAVRFEPAFQDEKYQEILLREFNHLTIENEMKMAAIHPEKDRFSFDRTDELIELAEENDMEIRGHTLVWGEEIPQWVYEQAVDEERTKQVLKLHIQMLVERYKGRVNEWDVVNEAWNDDGTFRENFWYRMMGPSYIPLAFSWASEADPEAVLYYNDYGIEKENVKAASMFNYLNKWKREGYPIHGIGVQAHLDAADPGISIEEMKTNFAKWGQAGFVTAVTELDIKLQNMGEPRNERLDTQAELYGDITAMCMKESSCQGVTVWGAGDAESWLISQESEKAEPLLFDDNWVEKPAYHAVKKSLFSARFK